MGSKIEVNSLVRLPDTINANELVEGQRVQFIRENERIIPLQIALLMINQDWNFYGYCRVVSLQTKQDQTQVEIEVLTLFNKDESKIYKDNFRKAGLLTGEINS